jgi:hypothetical protein
MFRMIWIVIMTIATFAGCKPAMDEATMADYKRVLDDNQRLRAENARKNNVQQMIRDAAQNAVSGMQGLEQKPQPQPLPGPAESPTEDTEQPIGAFGGAQVLASERRDVRLYDPSACGQEGPNVGYLNGVGFRWQVPGAFEENPIHGTCSRSCLMIRNMTVSHLVIYVTNGDDGHEQPLTICSGTRATDALPVIDNRRGFQGWMSALLPAESGPAPFVAVGKIFGRMIVSVSECSQRVQGPLQCEASRTVFSGSFPAGIRNGKYVDVGPLASQY